MITHIKGCVILAYSFHNRPFLWRENVVPSSSFIDMVRSMINKTKFFLGIMKWQIKTYY